MNNARRPTKSLDPGAISAAVRDLRERDAAADDDGALVRYEAKWQRKLRRLQQAYPERWTVPGLSDEEVRDVLTLRLIEAVRSRSFGPSDEAQSEKEWGFLVIKEELRALRKTFRLGVAPADIDDSPLPTRTLTQEEQWLEAETSHHRHRAKERALRGLSRPQLRWWAALNVSASSGAFFASSSEPNLTAASRVLGKNRSSAQRAYRELQNRFESELLRADSNSSSEKATKSPPSRR